MIKIERKPNSFSLPTVIILSLIMYNNIEFFIINNYSSSYLLASIIWSIFIMITFFLMLYTGDIGRYRQIFFTVYALTFFPSFIAMLYETRGHMHLSISNVFDLETPYCHIVTTMTMIPYILTKTIVFPAKVDKHFASVYAMFLIWFFATITIGKGWCSFVCFYGGTEEGISKIAKKPIWDISNAGFKLRYFSFVMLAFVVLVTLATLAPVYCEWLCPFKTITEYAEITDIRSFIATGLFFSLFTILVIILPYMTKKRFQCTTFCPFGAFQSLFDKFSIYRVRINTEKCIQCMKCVKICPTLSIDEETIKNKKGKPLITCTKCGVCISNCPANAISYSFAGIDNKKIGKIGNYLLKLKDLKDIKSKIKYGILNSLCELLSPQALYLISAMTLGMIISSGFSIGTIHRLINLFKTGSFILNIK